MVRLVDNRGRLFGKINIVDIVVLLVIVALAVFVAVRVTDEDVSVSVETTSVKVTYLVQPADPMMVDAYRVLGPLTDKNGKALGTIEKTEVLEMLPVQFMGFAGDYSLRFPVAPKVRLVVSAQGTVYDDGFVRVGSTAIRVGDFFKVLGPGWEASAEIAKVEWGAAATK
jgi:hypothetical protein